MSRLRDRLEARRAAGGKGLIAYLTAGDPALDVTVEAAVRAAAAGADAVELGVPFSDPTADGPVLRAAMQRALGGGVTLDRVLAAAHAIRARSDVPIVLFGYCNPFWRRGPARLAAEAAAAGCDGVLIVDLPFDEAAAGFLPALRGAGLDYVPLCAPTGTPARLAGAAAAATGFLYFVSVAGITGTAPADLAPVRAGIATLRAHTGVPIAVGFGVRTPADAARVAALGDAVVVGTALHEAMQGAPATPAEAVGAAVAALRAGLDRGR